MLLPELELLVGSHALGAKFTTLEGLLRSVLDQVEQNPFAHGSHARGDRVSDDELQRLTCTKERLNRMIEGEELPFMVVLDDPTGNSYLQVLPVRKMPSMHYGSENKNLPSPIQIGSYRR